MCVECLEAHESVHSGSTLRISAQPGSQAWIDPGARLQLRAGVFATLVGEAAMEKHWHHTTICAVRRNGITAVACDGQVTFGSTVLKHGASKLRRLGGGRVVAGFAGSVADALALFARFETKLEEFAGNLERASVELARDWRTDRALRHLEAMMIVADRETLLLLSGSGEVIAPDDGVLTIGSGGAPALAAARALLAHTTLEAAEIAREALRLASAIDLYTNDHISVEVTS
jgi:ATP-dependent HslUV protease, peptidase subunit HslV